MRIGHGYDVHPLIEKRKLILGGVEIDYPFGLKGHSDADVVLHAVCDAILGALGLGDIGQHFPDTDAKYKGIDSRILLKQVADKMHQSGFMIGNIDVTIIAQKPKLLSYLDSMKNNIAHDCLTAVHCVNIKATTTEHLGFVGRLEGIASHCVVILKEDER